MLLCTLSVVYSTVSRLMEYVICCSIWNYVDDEFHKRDFDILH
jgi:hypothetical protein